MAATTTTKPNFGSTAFPAVAWSSTFAWEAVAAGLVLRIDKLFAVDAAAREQKLDHAQRHQLRQQESAPLLDPLREALKAARNNSLPASSTAKPVAKINITE